MSHISQIDIVITDVDSLRSAIAELKRNGVKCELLENAVPRAYYSDQLPEAPFVVEVTNGDYDVGLYKTEDGKAYTAKCDFYKGSIQRELGIANATNNQSRLGKLYQMYGVHAATKQAIQQGYNVHRINKPDGTIQLQVAA